MDAIVSDEDRMANELMEARPRVRIFSSVTPAGLEGPINDWLAASPGVEILRFFPVSLAASVSVTKAVAMAPKEVKTPNCDHGNSEYPHTMNESDKAEIRDAAVGVYYVDRGSRAAPARVEDDVQF